MDGTAYTFGSLVGPVLFGLFLGSIVYGMRRLLRRRSSVPRARRWASSLAAGLGSWVLLAGLGNIAAYGGGQAPTTRLSLALVVLVALTGWWIATVRGAARHDPGPADGSAPRPAA